MRPVTHGDIAAAARVVLGAPESERLHVIQAMLHEADSAEHYRRLWSKVHPGLGNGTLMSAALRHNPGPEPLAGDLDYLRAMLMVIEALLDWHAASRGT